MWGKRLSGEERIEQERKNESKRGEKKRKEKKGKEQKKKKKEEGVLSALAECQEPRRGWPGKDAMLPANSTCFQYLPHRL